MPAKPNRPHRGLPSGSNAVQHHARSLRKEYNAPHPEKAGYVIPVEISVLRRQAASLLTKQPRLLRC